MITWRFYWRIVASLTITAGCWLSFEMASLLAGKRRRMEVIYRWVPRWARNMLYVFNVELLPAGPLYREGQLVTGRDAKGLGYIFIANHRSSLDILVLLSLLEAHCISRHDVARWPIIGKAARRVGTLFVDRTSRRSGAAVLKEVAHALEGGKGVAMFPEGTSFAGDEVREFRTGAFNAARRSGAQLVPIGLAYSDPQVYFVDQTALEHAKKLLVLKQVRVAVEFGKPIELGGQETVEVMRRARTTIQELVNRARKRLEQAAS